MFLLKWPAFPNPFWFSAKVRGDAVEGEVISENTVKTSIDTLNLLEGELPTIGTKVVIIPGGYHLVGKTEEEIEKEKAERKAALKEYRLKEENERRQREKAVREKAKQSNEKLRIPVKWTSGFKSVISGLTENSNCDELIVALLFMYYLKKIFMKVLLSVNLVLFYVRQKRELMVRNG